MTLKRMKTTNVVRAMPASGRGKGFALLDLMVSVLILGLMLVPLAMARNNVIVSAGHTVQMRKARILAAGKIGELEIQKPEELAAGVGDFGAEYPGFAWETKVETVPLWDVVGLSTPVDETGMGTTLGTDPQTGLMQGTTDQPVDEMIRLTLTVKFTIGEEEEKPAEGAAEEEIKRRPVNSIEIVRYFRKPLETGILK